MLWYLKKQFCCCYYSIKNHYNKKILVRLRLKINLGQRTPLVVVKGKSFNTNHSFPLLFFVAVS